jgi:two-component system, NtrC family, sensor histidine kinase KinB
VDLKPDRDRDHLEVIYLVSRELARHLDLSDVLTRSLEMLVGALQASGGSVAVLGERGSILDAAVAVEGSIIPHAMAQLSPVMRQGLAGWVLTNGKSVLVEDTHKDPRWIPSDPLLVPTYLHMDNPTRSAVSVPLQGREGVVGVLTLVHFEPGFFSADDLRLLSATAETVGLAVENAQLYMVEHQRRLIASTLQEIARTINSSLEPEKVFALILDQLSKVIRFDSATLLLLDNDCLRVGAARGFESSANLNEVIIPYRPDIPSWKTIKERRPIMLEDAQAVPGWFTTNSLPQSVMIRGWIGAPLLVHDQPVGVLAIDSHQPGAYTEADAQLVMAFADQAATAVANSWLYNESQQQARTMAIMAETTRMIVSSLDLDEVLMQVLGRVVMLLAVEAGSIALLEEPSGHLVFRAAVGPQADKVKGVRLEIGEGIVGWVAQNGRALVSPNVSLEPRFNPRVDQISGYVTHAVIGVPIFLRDKTLGVLEVINPRRGSFSPQSLQVLEYITGMAASAISHAQLFAATHAAEQRYSTLFQDSIDPIMITDLDGRIVDANARALQFTGFTREELLRIRIQALHSVYTGKLGQRFSDITHGEVRNYESRIRTRSGNQAPVELYVKRISSLDPEQDSIQWIIRDIAERAGLDELRADLTSMLFHDMRSPLGNVISSLQLLADPPPADETVRSLIAISLRSARRLNNMIDSLLDLRRLEEGRAVIRRVKISLAALIAEAVEEAQPVAEGKGILLNLNLPLNLPSVEGDPDMIRRVIGNLLDNAVKYTPGGGSIRLSASLDAESVRVSIADSGPGIPPEERHRIFDKYSRIERVGAPKGLGLGLAFCRLAVKAHGGRIWVDSPAEGGAAFHFTVPLAVAPEENPSPE